MKFLVTLIMTLTLAAVIYFMNPQVWASESAGKTPTRAQTKELMDQFLSHMVALKPYLVSEEKFADSKNAVEIDGHLKELAKLSKRAAHDPRLQLPGYRVSQKVLQDHVAETERVFRVGNNHYARWMLNATLSICMSCHTQIPTVSRELKNFEGTNTFVSKFDQAEFLFATRGFDQAKDLFDGLISNYPSDKLKSDQLETALERVIAYYARIKRDPEAATAALMRYQKNNQMPEYLQGDISAWIKSFEEWKKDPTPEFKSESQVIEFAQKNLNPKVSGYVMTTDDPRAAVYLKVSGVLYEYLQKHPNSAVTPELLYWLAICDKGLSNNFFFSLGDIYLKECVIGFPQSPAAKKCYDEYEQETIVSYSGSAGTNIPEDVKRELATLKALVNSPSTQGVKH
jgi:hypothetical protein